MKSEPKRKQPSTQAAKPSRSGEAAAAKAPRSGVTIAVQKPAPHVPAEQPRAAATDGSLPVPDLSKYGVPEREAREHLHRCEPCGRAHKHVVKNPKDVMALDAFGRHIATCIAVQGEKAQA